MKEESEIVKRLDVERSILGGCCIYYECVGDFYRGWMAALNWVLDRESPQLSKPADEEVSGCSECARVDGSHNSACSHYRRCR